MVRWLDKGIVIKDNRMRFSKCTFGQDGVVMQVD